jgi:hypothetical protein
LDPYSPTRDEKEKTYMQISDGKWDGRHNFATRKAQINTRTHPK